MKFPYGICNFHKLITENYFYADRTDRIRLIEETGSQLLFLRPRRFGKTLLLSMLENYYDVAKADEFEKLFGHLSIGQNPTDRHNQYFVMSWDFSVVDAQGEPREIKQTLHRYLNSRIRDFAVYYQELLPAEIKIESEDAIASLQSLLTAVSQTSHSLYLLIDEYDNFANEIMMGSRTISQERYRALFYGEGSLKTLFKAIKSASTGRGLDRVFITGVSPVVLSDITNGYNGAENIYLLPEFNDLCGFSESEIADILTKIVSEHNLPQEKVDEALTMMRTFYNGYSFSYDLSLGGKVGFFSERKKDDTNNLVYNPTLALYFMKSFQHECQYPRKLLDTSLAMGRGKIEYISRLPNGEQVILNALDESNPLSISELAHRFGLEDMLSKTQDTTFIASLLYFFGVLTLNGTDPLGKLILAIPNLVVQKLYVEQVRERLLPDSWDDKEEMSRVTELFYSTGNIKPLCDFIERRFVVFNNRDYRWSNELTIKTAFLTLLFNDTFYIIDSEAALKQDYADLTMIIRPDMRKYQLLDFIIGFKYISLKELNLSADQVKQMRNSDLKALTHVQQKFAESKSKLDGYRKTLEDKYGDKLRLHCYSVVALGFERLVWIEIKRDE